MKIFKNKLANRLAISKSLGFLIWLLGFFCIPYFFADADIYFKLAILFWYTTFWGIIGLMGVMSKHPAIEGFKLPWWFRWIFIGAWLDFVIALFMYHSLDAMMVWTMFEGWSPFWIVAEWAIVWFIIDWITTAVAGDGKKLCKFD